MAAEEEAHPCSSKELKAYARPIFAREWEKYYPTVVLKDYGFERVTCKCGHNYWRASPERTTCGDSNCEGKYGHIGVGCGIGAQGHKITYKEAWEGFKSSFETTTPPHTAIKRYPVVARWRDDVDYVAAGIYAFQPYCVSGELKPPANPLICPQFCLRFNDLDSIGISGRHYSGFVMIGIQSFYPQEDTEYPRTRLIENNLRWLTETLGIPKGTSRLSRMCGLGAGIWGRADMVKKTWAPLPLRVMDVGIGLERIPFLVNGSNTSYTDVFPEALAFLKEKTGAEVDASVWRKFGPYSCLLNIDECEDIDKTWAEIAERLGMEVKTLREGVELGRDLIVVADHTRTFLVAIEDGSLPSSTGGGSNLRSLLRRVFAVLGNRGWWEKIGGVEGLCELMAIHRETLRGLYGTFTENPSLEKIVRKEYEKWRDTDNDAVGRIIAVQNERAKEIERREGAAKGSSSSSASSSASSSSSSAPAGGKGKKGGGKGGKDGKAVKDVELTVEDWIKLSTTYGVMPDQIAKVTGQQIPQNYYSELAEMKEKTTRQLSTGVNAYAEQMKGVPETKELLYARREESDPAVEKPMDLEDLGFEGRCIRVFVNNETRERDLVVLDETLFYPTSGGQENDTGKLWIEFGGGEGEEECSSSSSSSSSDEKCKCKCKCGKRKGKEFAVVDVVKCGHCVAHRVVPALTEAEASAIAKGWESGAGAGAVKAYGEVDRARRYQLACHHTATHLVHAAAQHVLGPHVWQASAKKTVSGAHLDITHFAALTREEVRAIQDRANALVMARLPITKRHMKKEDAEREHGFSLYQGGVVPGLNVRVVSMGDADVEACCGSHLNNTQEVLLIRVVGATREGDGAVRLEFVAGPRARESYEELDERDSQICKAWATTPAEFYSCAVKFFDAYKLSLTLLPKYQNEIVKRAFTRSNAALTLVATADFSNLTWCIARAPVAAKRAIRAAQEQAEKAEKEKGEKGAESSEAFIGSPNGKWGVVFVGPTYVYGILGWVPPATSSSSSLIIIGIGIRGDHDGRAEGSCGCSQCSN
ncbi:alanyl-tRNA synthetase, incomplete, only N-terminal part [Monocercomonoides exilis]|uniref:alanyl-tRNA synthetase, incomplete, only N-terminal part n=1 Tax=Monocercomonoides exilis TaxID=2049356 RepID=UPI00355A6E6C|nr:alanyl-tRNA synthetase, incomplete, only N-terminal part [Monocercomonoides exilis]